MVTDKQVRILMKLINQEKTLLTAAAKAGMCEKTARKYRKSGKLPSQFAVSDGAVLYQMPAHKDLASDPPFAVDLPLERTEALPAAERARTGPVLERGLHLVILRRRWLSL